MKFLYTIVFVLVFQFANAQVPSSPIILREARPRFTSTIELNGSSTNTVKYTFQIFNDGSSPVTDCGFYYSYNTAYSDPALDPNDVKVSVRTNSNNHVSFTGTSSAITFLIAPYCFIPYVTNRSGTYLGTCTILAPNWPTVSYGGKIWAAANLGSSVVATSQTDTNSYGWYYQWGRGSDGHQLSSSPVTTTASNTDTPGNNLFINRGGIIWWRNTNNDNLWQGVAGVNNPCPPLYRVANEGDWSNNYTSLNTTGGYASPLKLTHTGNRNPGGDFSNVGMRAFIHTSTPGNSYANYRAQSDTGYNFMSYSGTGRSYGAPIRCVKD